MCGPHRNLLFFYCRSPDFPIPTSQTKIWRGSRIAWLVVYLVTGHADDSSYVTLDCLWTVSRLTLDCLWTVSGLLLDCRWTASRLSMDCLWPNITGIPGHSWGYPGIPGGTNAYPGVPGNTQGYLGIPGGTRVCLVSLKLKCY